MDYIFLFILGSAFGSFLNVLTDRWSAGESIMGRSYCDNCRHKLAWNDLIPIFSFFLLKGKCRYCHKKISFFYPLVEFITGITFLVGWLYSPASWITGAVTPERLMIFKILFIALLSCLVVIFFADAKYQVIPDEIQVIFLLLSVSILFVQGINYLTFLKHLLAAFVLMLSILSLFLITHGRGMGFGDVKLSFSIGLLLGVKNGFLSLYFAFVLGAVIGLVFIALKRKKMKSKIAFGPFLVFGMLTIFFWQEQIMLFIRKMYGY